MLRPGPLGGDSKGHLFLWFGICTPGWSASSKSGFSKGSPFIILSVSSAVDVATCALLAGGFGLVAFQSFGLAGNTSCERYY